MRGEWFWFVIIYIFLLLADSETIKIFLAAVAMLVHFVPRWIEYGVKCYFDKLEETKCEN